MDFRKILVLGVILVLISGLAASYGTTGDGAEPPPNPECDDGVDNDGDGEIDYPNDPGCTGYDDDSEDSSCSGSCTYECNDGADNDNDGAVDYSNDIDGVPNDPECSSPTDDDEGDPPPPPPPEYTQCNDGIDNDGDDKIDGNDPGCTEPYYKDNSEANIWDSDLTATMIIEGGDTLAFSLSETESVFFDAWVEEGTDTVGPDKTLDDEQGDELTERYIDAVHDEDSAKWAGGDLLSNTYSTPSDADLLNDRFLDPVHDDNSQGNRCGDGIRNDDESAENEGNVRDDDTSTPWGDTTPCRADYGRTWEKYYVKSPYDDEGSTGMKCESDDAECNNADVDCDDCSSCPCSGSCNTPTPASCEVTDDNNHMEGNMFWEIRNGDTIYQEECTEDGSVSDNPVASTSDSCTVNEQDTESHEHEDDSDTSDTSGSGKFFDWRTEGVTFQSYSGDLNMPNRAGGTDSTLKRVHTICEGDSYDCSTDDEAGQHRSWEEQTSKDCNDYNVVDGGGDTNDDYGYGSGDDKNDNDPAGTYTDFTAHSDDSWGGSHPEDGKVWCGYESRLTVDADGPKGMGDGFVVVVDAGGGSFAGFESPDGSSDVGTRVLANGDYENYRHRISQSCPDDYEVCLKYVDYYTEEGSGTQGSPEWSTVSDAVEMESETFLPSDSYSVCKKVNQISGEELVKCDYDPDGPGEEVCGDQSSEYWAYMEGPEINEGIMEENSIDYQTCVDSTSDCVLKGKEVSEGTVADVAPDKVTDQYEEGTNSPDWEVCLNIDQSIPGGTGDDAGGDNYDYDHDGSTEEAGGEWYDLDDERINSYLQTTGSGMVSSTQDAALVDSNGDGVADEGDIDFYWHKNVNPDDPTHNPHGNEWGVAVEDDCDSALSGCDDTNTAADQHDPIFYSNLTEGARDEDHHPQSQNTGAESPLFYGYYNKISDDSNQLEPDMDTSTFDAYSFDSSRAADDGDITKWFDSRGGADWADQFAVAQNLTTSISNRGGIYPAGGAYYRSGSNIREDPDDTSVLKMDKVFGNSFADVASQDITRESNEVADAGDGVWIDPDYIKQGWDTGEYQYTSIFSSWQDKLVWNIDITGPDSGLGLNTGDDQGITFKDSNRKWVMWGDVYFEGERDNQDNDGNDGADEDWNSPGDRDWTKVGEHKDTLEPPLCGDDQREYLLEEVGESVNPAQFSGRYACSDSQQSCITRDNGPKVVPAGTLLEMEEPDENVGRLKNDREICNDANDTKGLSETVYKWWDQDYGDLDGDGNQETCQENSLYGSEGVRWITSDYIKDHPYAVTGGIDDDWNQYLADQEALGDFTGNYTYKPGRSSWSSSVIQSNHWTPVPSGGPNRSVATLGFCGGDDDGEHLVTQRCQTSLCETDNSVMGVASDQSFCMMDGSRYPLEDPDNQKRKLFETGDTVTFDLSGSNQEVGCFDGTWFDSWPVVFDQERMDVGSGETRRVSFRIINVEDEERSFDVEIQDATTQPHIVQFTDLVSQSGDGFTTTVEARSSKEFQVELYGGNTDIDSDDSNGELRIQADAQDSPISGEDMLAVDVLPVGQTGTTGGNRTAEPRNVPGIGFIHVIVLMMLSAAFVFTQR